MGVNQDAYDVWTDYFKDERRKFLEVLYFTNLEHKLPLPNQDDFSIKNYDDLDNKTKLAIKEFIFASFITAFQALLLVSCCVVLP